MRDYDSYSKKLGRNTVGRGRLALAVAMLLVATGMLVAPLAMVAHRVPEIVRLLADFWQ